MSSFDIIGDFKFVTLPVFYRNGSECQLILLIDYMNHINDYRVIWKKFCITEYTTPTHFEKPDIYRFQFRDKLLEKLNLKHLKNPISGVRKIYIPITSENQLNNINNLFWNDWIGQTIPNISYILTGSNPAGENNPKQAEFWTKLINQENKRIAIGMFLDSIMYKKVKKFLRESTYISIWNDFKQGKSEFKIINFEQWLWLDETKTFKRYLEEFNKEKLQTSEWKSLKKQLSNFRADTRIIDSVSEIAQNNRSKIRSIIINKYGDLKNFMTKFWKHDFSRERDRIELAHIKSCKWCKDEACNIAIKTRNITDEAKQILDQIKDENNIIPLKYWYHQMFDTNNIYWNDEGKIMLSKSLDFDKKKLIIDDDLFNTIPDEFLNKTKRYLLIYKNSLQNLNDFDSIVNLIKEN